MPAATGRCERRLVTAEHVHGKTGLDGPDLPEPKMHAAGPSTASTSSSRRCCAEPAGTITLCTLGPLTNIAMALVKAPAIAGASARS